MAVFRGWLFCLFSKYYFFLHMFKFVVFKIMEKQVGKSLFITYLHGDTSRDIFFFKNSRKLFLGTRLVRRDSPRWINLKHVKHSLRWNKRWSRGGSNSLGKIFKSYINLKWIHYIKLSFDVFKIKKITTCY